MDIITIYYVVGIIVGLISITSALFYLVASRLRPQWEESIKVAVEANSIALKEEIKKDISIRVGFLKKDFEQLKEDLDEIKILIKAQQETLLAIQLSIGEVKPSVANLEKRVGLLER